LAIPALEDAASGTAASEEGEDAADREPAQDAGNESEQAAPTGSESELETDNESEQAADRGRQATRDSGVRSPNDARSPEAPENARTIPSSKMAERMAQVVDGCRKEAEPVTMDTFIGQPEAAAFAKKMIERLGDVTLYHKDSVPNGAIFAGPRGLGKTQLAHTIAHESGCPIYSLDSNFQNFASKQSGVIDTLFDTAYNVSSETQKPVILFFDECDDLMQSRSDKRATNAITAIKREWKTDTIDKVNPANKNAVLPRVFVIACTNYPNGLSPDLLNRFGSPCNLFTFKPHSLDSIRSFVTKQYGELIDLSDSDWQFLGQRLEAKTQGSMRSVKSIFGSVLGDVRDEAVKEFKAAGNRNDGSSTNIEDYTRKAGRNDIMKYLEQSELCVQGNERIRSEEEQFKPVIMHLRRWLTDTPLPKSESYRSRASNGDVVVMWDLVSWLHFQSPDNAFLYLIGAGLTGFQPEKVWDTPQQRHSWPGKAEFIKRVRRCVELAFPQAKFLENKTGKAMYICFFGAGSPQRAKEGQKTKFSGSYFEPLRYIERFDETNQVQSLRKRLDHLKETKIDLEAHLNDCNIAIEELQKELNEAQEKERAEAQNEPN
jgi:SpoVK/Ycf46/Vps4 family AAA+-type ATPase